ncbi:alpha/beta fold hydrolase [Pseudomonas sp. G(2018)]|uniref:alpha/beta fold hydrolase n=1 Tax=Pseudomonas sp. G(2018) TaxID=2502242 RepID=UPI0010F53D32|nr:alpha/beta fold hydrolase [Pseudomonas sp. G(2018)]
MFAGFLNDQRHVNGVDITYRIGGSGPGLLLLHGHPQTHVIWHKVAEQLAEHFTVIAADLRGYGDSSKPPADDQHASYSKREMARDGVELEHDQADIEAGHQLNLPLLVLWGAEGTVGRCFEPLREWQQVATDVRGKALPAGHYIAEEVPELLLAEVLGFLR